MNSRQLEAFQAVMKTGSMSDAGKLLDVTQPAISRLIKDLETTLAFKLFLRENGRLYPTPGAQKFFLEVQRHFVGIERLQQTVNDIRSMKADSLQIAVIPALANSVMADIIARFNRTEPDLSMKFDCLSAEELATNVANRHYDLGIISLPFIGDELKYGHCFSSRCKLIMPNSHFLSAKSRIDLQDLEHETLISCGESHNFQRLKVNSLLEEQLIRPNQHTSTNQFETAAKLVEQQMGVSIVDPFTAEEFSQRGGSSAELNHNIPFYFGFILPGSRKTPAVVQRFMDFTEAGLMQVAPLQPVDPLQITHRS